MLHLPHVTLVTIDTEEHQLTSLAIRDTLAHITPEGLIIFTNRRAPYYEFKTAIECEIGTSIFSEIYKTLWYLVPEVAEVATPHSSHILLIQWDGWVIDPTQWTDKFLDYDYIGAPWPWHQTNRVGNGGFSLRSIKLLRTLSENRGRFPFRLPSDDAICRQYRADLEENFQIRFAPEPLAWQFSKEHMDEKHLYTPSFGFHDPRYMKQHLSDDEWADRLTAAGPYALKKFRELGVTP